MTSQLIPQSYAGRMNVVGDCFVFGAALHDNHPVYLDIAGPATSVEAVWAKLAQGKEARIVPDAGSSISKFVQAGNCVPRTRERPPSPRRPFLLPRRQDVEIN